ncbi:MAG: retropepsin-like aspartic protease, partial [Bacteroidota bacterium]
MRNSYLIILILFFQLTIGNAQRADLRLETDDNKVEIPFEYVNNFIVVEVIFNNLLPLKFIFDTGAEYTLLTKKEITDLFLVNYDKRFEVLGSDMETVLYAYLARGVNMRMNEFSALNRSILVLEEDYFRFEKYAGIEVQGILGADIFSRFVVQID